MALEKKIQTDNNLYVENNDLRNMDYTIMH